jgi:hypothetical protein
MLITPATGLGRLAMLITEKPFATNCSAVAAPIPELAPVIMAVSFIRICKDLLFNRRLSYAIIIG